MEDAQLSQYGASIVIDLLCCEAVVGVECVETAEREFDAAARRRKTAPAAEVRPSNDNFDNDGLVADVAALHVDFEVGQRLHEQLVELAHAASSVVMLAPRFVVVMGLLAERAEHAFEIMRILEPNMLFDEGDARRAAAGCGHITLHRLAKHGSIKVAREAKESKVSQERGPKRRPPRVDRSDDSRTRRRQREG
jgi:hypothetical protein